MSDDVIEIELVPVVPGRYAALCMGEELCRSRTPFVDAARVLKGMGFAPAMVVVARHRGSPMIAMRCPLGKAAGFAVSDTDHRGLQRHPYKPFERFARQPPFP